MQPAVLHVLIALHDLICVESFCSDAMIVSEASLPCSSEFTICSPATDAPLHNCSLLPKQDSSRCSDCERGNCVEYCTDNNRNRASQMGCSINIAFRLHAIQIRSLVAFQGINSSSDFKFVGANIGVQCSSAGYISRVNIKQVGVGINIRARQTRQLVKIGHPSVQSSHDNRLALFLEMLPRFCWAMLCQIHWHV